MNPSGQPASRAPLPKIRQGSPEVRQASPEISRSAGTSPKMFQSKNDSLSSRGSLPHLGRKYNAPKRRYKKNRAEFLSQALSITSKENEHGSLFLDVTLVIGPEQLPFRANKALLAIGSPFFREKFISGEMDNNIVVLEEFNEANFEKVLAVIYNAKDCFKLGSMSEAWDLYQMAEKLGLVQLLKTTTEYLRSHMSDRNYSIEILQETAHVDIPDVFFKPLKATIWKNQKFILQNEKLNVLDLEVFKRLLMIYLEKPNWYSLRTLPAPFTIYRAAILWGKHRPDFANIIRADLFKFIEWKKLSKNQIRTVLKEQILPSDLENIVMKTYITSR